LISKPHLERSGRNGKRSGERQQRSEAQLADTHALYWYLTNSPRLGTQANLAFHEADQGLAEIYLPVIVLAELSYLNEKFGRNLDFASELQRLASSGQFVLVPLLPDDILDLAADSVVPEMHDRLIVGVARRLNAPVLTRDPAIVGSQLVATIW
jgi:PIN domain nuclease of toxin-antitoxin system